MVSERIIKNYSKTSFFGLKLIFLTQQNSTIIMSQIVPVMNGIEDSLLYLTIH